MRVTSRRVPPRHVFRTALIVAALAFPAGAAEGQDVKTWQKRLVDGAKPTPAGVRVRVIVTESPVEAAGAREFSAALVEAQRGARSVVTEVRAPNWTSWQLTWDWDMENHLSRCRFKNVTVTATLRADFAALAGPVAQDSAAKAWWSEAQERSLDRRLRTLKVLRDEAKGLAQAFRSLESTSCSELGMRANDIGRTRVGDAYARAQETYRAAEPER